MADATYQFQTRQGKAWARVWTLTNDDDSPMDVTGMTFSAVFHTSTTTIPVTFELTADDAELDTNQVRLSLTAVQTASAPPNVYTTELDWADSSGRTDTTPDVVLQWRNEKQRTP